VRDFFPSFFLVGAPRCGTTALAKYLKEHPHVCFSRPKETHYFSKIHSLAKNPDVQRDYLDRFFPDLSGEHRAIGEGSVTYLYSVEALKHILKLNPDARFIAMVRNPMEMVPSFHQLLCFYMEEDVTDFARAWALREERARGRRLPKRCVDPRLLQYDEIGQLGKHVDQLFHVAGRERSRVLVYDDFASDPHSVYRDVLRFIGVDDDGRTHFPTRKPSRRVHSPGLHRLLYWHPPRADRLVTYIHGRVGRSRTSRLRLLRKRLIRANSQPQPPSEVDSATREELRAEFADDIARLGTLLGRDFSHWS
jgi:hypothetical protein